MSRPYFPNGHADKLSAVLVSIDPKVPLYGAQHLVEVETPILGFERDADGSLQPVLLIQQREGESLVIVDRTGKQPCWFDWATSRRFEQWRGVCDLIHQRHEQGKREAHSSTGQEMHPPITEPSIGPAGDPFGVGQEPGRRDRPQVSAGGTPPPYR